MYHRGGAQPSHHAAGGGGIGRREKGGGRREERGGDAPDGPGRSHESHTCVIHTNAAAADKGLKNSCGCDSVVSGRLVLIVASVCFLLLVFCVGTNPIQMVARYFFKGRNNKNIACFFFLPLDQTERSSHCVKNG